MEKMSKNMLKQVLSALSHMVDIDEKSEKSILDELQRIKGKIAPKKKEGAGDVALEEKPLEKS